MKTRISLLSIAFLTILLLTGNYSCKKENKPFTLETLLAGAVDLNGTVAATSVPVDKPIIATFSGDIEASSVDSAITLLSDYDQKYIQLGISVNDRL